MRWAAMTTTVSARLGMEAQWPALVARKEDARASGGGGGRLVLSVFGGWGKAARSCVAYRLPSTSQAGEEVRFVGADATAFATILCAL